jgi:hypothetical protein
MNPMRYRTPCRFGVLLALAVVCPGCGSSDDVSNTSLADAELEAARDFDSPDSASSLDEAGDREDERVLIEAAPEAEASVAESGHDAMDGDRPEHAIDPPLPVCLRINDPEHPDVVRELSRLVGVQYRLGLSETCEVRNILFPANREEFSGWSNRLYLWSLALWGCSASQPTRFELVNAEVMKLTSADAQRLIELYLAAARPILELSAAEVTFMRATLETLATTVVSAQAAEHAWSDCDSAPDAEPSDGPAQSSPDTDALDEASASSWDAGGT